jgi:hypothetical protein
VAIPQIMIEGAPAHAVARFDDQKGLTARLEQTAGGRQASQTGTDYDDIKDVVIRVGLCPPRLQPDSTKSDRGPSELEQLPAGNINGSPRDRLIHDFLPRAAGL